MRQLRPKVRSHKRYCQDPACTGVQASYGYEDVKKLIRCVTHKEEGMILLTGRKCEAPTCKKIASFGQRQPGTKVSDVQLACAAYL
jgi:EsV-1-7 cysteine-rich motif